MAPNLGGACGHCGGTGFNLNPIPFDSTYECKANNGSASSSSQHNTSPDDTMIQYPVTLELGPLDTSSYPFIPYFDPSDIATFPETSSTTGTVSWTGEDSKSFGDLFGDCFNGMDTSMLSEPQLSISPLLQAPDFDMAVDYSNLFYTTPELDLHSDLDTTSSLTPPEENLPSPPNLINTPSDASSETTRRFKCDFCTATYPSRPKLNVHIKKHTKPHKCPVPGCGYAAAEKKSLHRHVAAGAKWDEDHELAARRTGVSRAEYCCRYAPECTYASRREDNRNRHEKTCAQRLVSGVGGEVR